MVQILRDQIRQYAADRKDAIQMQNMAATVGDIGNVVSGGAKIAQSVGDIRDELAKPDIAKAQQALEIGQAKLDAWNADQLRSGKVVADSPEYEQAYRKKAAEIFKSVQPDIKWSKAQEVYGTGVDSYLSKGVAANIRYAARIRQEQDVAAANATAKAATQNLQTLSNDYITKARQAGSLGSSMDFSGLTDEFGSAYDEQVGTAGLPSERLAAKVGTKLGGMIGYYESALSSPDENIIKAADASLTSNETFRKVAPESFISEYVEYRKDNQLNEWRNERLQLESELATTDAKSGHAKELQKSIEDIDKKIETLESKGLVDKNSFEDAQITELREMLKSETGRLALARLGERALVAREEEFQAHKEMLAVGTVDPYDMRTQMWLDGNAKKEQQEANMTKAVRNEDGTYSAVEKNGPMTYAKKNEDGTYSATEEKPKGMWGQMADNYRGYRNEMSKISEIKRSSFATKLEINNELAKLMSQPIETEMGEPYEFDANCMEFLYKMARSPLTESERRDYANYVGQLMLANNDEVQERRDLLQSGDVGIYTKDSTPGITKQERNVDDEFEETTGDLLADQRQGSFSFRGNYNANTGNFDYDNAGSFDKALKRAQAEYQTGAVNMMVNGATKQDVLNYKKQVFDKAINDWYTARHVVDLRALDEKLENHQPAYQNLDGIIYEYKGRDSIGRPLWKDNSMLNTNRDFARLNKAYKIGQQ